MFGRVALFFLLSALIITVCCLERMLQGVLFWWNVGGKKFLTNEPRLVFLQVYYNQLFTFLLFLSLPLFCHYFGKGLFAAAWRVGGVRNKCNNLRERMQQLFLCGAGI
jgi:hypothetical protein